MLVRIAVLTAVTVGLNLLGGPATTAVADQRAGTPPTKTNPTVPRMTSGPGATATNAPDQKNKPLFLAATLDGRSEVPSAGATATETPGQTATNTPGQTATNTPTEPPNGGNPYGTGGAYANPTKDPKDPKNPTKTNPPTGTKAPGGDNGPPPGGQVVGDPDGRATGVVRVLGNRVTFAFAWEGINAPTLGHIHKGDAGTNGDVVVPLFTTPMPAGITAAAGTVTVSDPKIADEMRTNPEGFYLNLHTEDFKDGAVRGQLAESPAPMDMLALLEGTGPRAQLSGFQEVPEAGGDAVGDPTGRGVAFVEPVDGKVGFALAWIGLQPTSAHIHKAPVGANGDIVVNLFESPVPTSVFAVAGSVDGPEAGVGEEIVANPADFYANVHTEQFPGGAIRGQLSAPRA